MNFLKGFSLTALASLVITVVAFVNNLIITRQIGPEGRGQYSVLYSLVLLLSLLFGEGIRRSNTIFVGKNKNTLNFLVIQTIVYSILIGAILILVLNTFSVWKEFLPGISKHLILITLIIAAFTILSQALQALFLGLENIYFFNLLQFLTLAAVLVINFFGVYFFNFGLEEVIYSLLIGTFFSVTVGLFKLNPKFSKVKFKNFFEGGFLALSSKSTFAALLIFVMLRSDIFLVNYFLGPVQAGLYNIAALFSEIIQKLPNVAGPLLISKSVNSSIEKSTAFTAQLVRIIILINLIVIIILYLIGYNLIVFLFKIEFAQSYDVLVFYLPGILAIGPGSIIYSFFMSQSFPPKIFLINGSMSLVNFILNIFLIPKYGIIAAASISSLSYFGWSLLYMVYFHKYTKVRYLDLIFVKKTDFAYLINYYFRFRER